MVTIGVTGHRFLAELDKLEAGVDQALAEAERVFGGPVTVVSALAEGADRLVRADRHHSLPADQRRGAHKFARDRSRFRANEVVLTHLAQRLRSESDPVRIFTDLWCCEQILESEHREWPRLMMEAEWVG